MPGALGIPGALGMPGALAMPGRVTSSTDNPHFTHLVASGSLSVPHCGHFIGSDIPDGLKHMISSKMI